MSIRAQHLQEVKHWIRFLCKMLGSGFYACVKSVILRSINYSIVCKILIKLVILTSRSPLNSLISNFVKNWFFHEMSKRYLKINELMILLFLSLKLFSVRRFQMNQALNTALPEIARYIVVRHFCLGHRIFNGHMDLIVGYCRRFTYSLSKFLRENVRYPWSLLCSGTLKTRPLEI